MLAVNVRTRGRKLRPTARLAVTNAGVSYAGATAWTRLPYRFEDPGDSSSNEWLRALLPAPPKPLKRGKADFFSFSIVFLRSVCFSTSCRLMRRKPPESAAGGGAGATSGLAGAPPVDMSSSTLLCDFLRPVKSPRPGLPMVRLSVSPWRGRRSQCPVWPACSGATISCTRGAAGRGVRSGQWPTVCRKRRVGMWCGKKRAWYECVEVCWEARSACVNGQLAVRRAACGVQRWWQERQSGCRSDSQGAGRRRGRRECRGRRARGQRGPTSGNVDQTVALRSMR